MTNEELLHFIITILEEHKALDLLTLDVRNLTNICDSLVICSASSRRHATAMADKLIRALREASIKPLGVEGENVGEWVLIDYTDIVVHIMLPEIREFYNLEKLWAATQSSRDQ
jgi:ribosome-associated protein